MRKAVRNNIPLSFLLDGVVSRSTGCTQSLFEDRLPQVSSLFERDEPIPLLNSQLEVPVQQNIYYILFH